MRQCAKENCFNEFISRGKYCEEHRRKRKPTAVQEQEEDDALLTQTMIEKLLLDDERRDLVAQQEQDYYTAMQMDMDNMRNKQLETERKLKIRQKFLSFPETSNITTLQFTFPEYCVRVKQNFPKSFVLRELFEFVDMFIEDNNFKIEDYQLVIYPNRIFRKQSDDSEMLLEDLSITNGLCLFVQRV
jgi:trehalose/maltose hydrolase-like predicted phosphorylase